MSNYSHDKSIITRKNLYLEIKGLMEDKGRLSLTALCALVSANEGSISVARNKVLREMDASSTRH